MFRLSPLLFFVLALFSAHVVFGAPSCTKHLDDCVSKCRQKFGLWPSSSTPSNVLPTPAVDADPYNLTTTTVTSSTYNPNASGVPPSDGGNDQLIQQTSTPSPTPTPTPSPTSSTPSSTPSTPSSSSGDVSTWLSAHNVVRAQHGANPLSWSDDLAAKAQQWANGCVFQHSGGSLGPYGENLAAGTGDYTSQDAVNDWVSEASQYDPNNPVASHFTQVVWKSTTQLGCAVATCSGIFPESYGAAQYYVCEYDPAGNIEGDGEFSANVQP